MSTLNTTNLKNPSSGSNNIVLNTDGSATIATLSSTTIQGTIQTGTASGPHPLSPAVSAVDFANIPSWVKRITVMFQGVSTTGSSLMILQLGTGSTPTYTASGYLSLSIRSITTSGTSGTSGTAGFAISGANTTGLFSGHAVLTNISTNSWICSHVGKDSTTITVHGGGDVSLAAALTAVRITTVGGTDTFDAGSINILFEG